MKITRSPNKPASGRNNGNKSVSSKNKNNKPAFRKNNTNSKDDGFNDSHDDVEHAKKLGKLKGHKFYKF